MDKHINELHLKPSDAMDHCEWKMTTEDWSDSDSVSDAVSWIQIVHFWFRHTQVNLD